MELLIQHDSLDRYGGRQEVLAGRQQGGAGEEVEVVRNAQRGLAVLIDISVLIDAKRRGPSLEDVLGERERAST